MKKCLFILISVLLALSAISAGDLKDEINKINRELERNMLSGNFKEQLKFYTDDAYSLPNFSPMMHGMDEFLHSHKQAEAMGMKVKKFKLETVDILDGGNFVVDIGKYSITMTMEGMPDPIDDAGKYLTVYERQEDGSLKIIAETWNADENPMENMPGGAEHSGNED